MSRKFNEVKVLRSKQVSEIRDSLNSEIKRCYGKHGNSEQISKEEVGNAERAKIMCHTSTQIFLDTRLLSSY